MLAGFEVCLKDLVNTIVFNNIISFRKFSATIPTELHNIVTGNLISSPVFRSEY
jgi:hypothetical protein